jgi:hypothetical protein
MAVVVACALGCADRPLYLPDETRGGASDLGVSDGAIDAAAADLPVPDFAMLDLPKPPLRLLAPLSTSTVTSRRPTFRWEGNVGTLQLCRDRACAHVMDSITGTQGSARPASPLPLGAVFWRVMNFDGRVTPTWEVFVGARDATLDDSYGTTLDLDGDGLADFAVGQLGFQPSKGVAYLYRGADPTRPIVLPCDDPYPDWWGCWTLASGGDLDGDGFGELVVGSIPGATPMTMQPGKVRIYYGGPGGIARTVTLTAPGTGYQFGRTVGGAGDVNGDGYGDLLVTSINDNPSVHDAWVLLGGPSDVGFDAGRFLVLEGRSLNTGITSAAGDFNGDGFGDVVLSDSDFNNNTGRLLVYYGSATGLSAPQVIASPGVTQFGLYLTAGDLDGDGYSDVVARGSSSATAWVFPGGRSGVAATATRQIAMPAGSDYLALAGDADGDGRDDLLMGGFGSGAHAWLFLSGPGAAHALNFPGGGAPSVAGAGDTDGDGVLEELVGSPPNAYLYRSDSDGGAARTLADPDGGTQFGYSVAGIH